MPRTGERIYHRKDGLWEARYVKDVDIFGKKTYGSVYGHTAKEAKDKRQEKEDNIRLFKRPIVTRNMTVSELVEEYLYVSKNRIKISTFQRYTGFLENHIKDTLNKQPVIYVTSLSIHEFATKKLEQGLAPQTVNSILVFLHSCFRYGHKQYSLPLPEIMYLSVEKREMRVFSEEEQKRLVTYLNRDLDIYKFGVLLALYTGLRIGELCALKWEDIKDGRINVRRTVQRLKSDTNSGTKLYIGTPKTITSIREIPVPSFLKELIEDFRIKSKQEFVLGTDVIPMAEPRIMQIKFKKYLSESGISEANFHTLRHTFATRCVECDFEIKSLSAVLGHSTVAITLNKYVHTTFQMKLDNMEKLRRIL